MLLNRQHDPHAPGGPALPLNFTTTPSVPTSSITGNPASTDGNDSSTTSAPTSGSANPSTSLLTIVIPIVLFVALFVLGCALILLRRRLACCLDSRPLPRSRVSAELPGDELASAPSDHETTTRRGGGRTRPRVARRTESGRSLRTLPEYNKEAGDDEMVLARMRAASPILGGSVTNEASEPAPNVMTQTGATVSLGPTPFVPGDLDLSPPANSLLAAAEPAAPARRSSLAIHPPPGRDWGDVPNYEQALSAPLPQPTRETASIPAPPASAVSMPRATPPTTSTSARQHGRLLARLTRNRLGHGHATVPPTTLGGRAGSASSLLLQPTTSRFSTASFGGSALGSPWASTHSLVISSPLPHSAVRASWGRDAWPRNGLSDDQMRFLSSTEAVTLAGVQVEGFPSPVIDEHATPRPTDHAEHRGLGSA